MISQLTITNRVTNSLRLYVFTHVFDYDVTFVCFCNFSDKKCKKVEFIFLLIKETFNFIRNMNPLFLEPCTPIFR